MDPIEIKGLLQKKTSAKGNEYYCVELYLTDTYKAVYFPNSAEVELIKAKLQQKNDSYNDFEQFK